MSALGGAKPAGGSTGIAPVPALISLVIFVIIFAIMYMYGGSLGLTALVGIVIGGLLIGFGVHFVPVGGAPAAMGQAPGIATGVAMLAAGGGLAGLFGGAWAASQGTLVAVVTGAIGGGLMLAITCFFVNFVYIYGMGIPAASGKVKKDPITGDTQPEYKSQGTEGHGLPFVSFVGGVIGGILGGAGGTLIYLMLLNVYQASLPGVLKATAVQIATNCSLARRDVCNRYVPCYCGACSIQHHRNDRRPARPEIQAVPTCINCIGSCIRTLRSRSNSAGDGVRC